MTVLIATAALALPELYWDANGVDNGFGIAEGIWGADVNWSTNALGDTLPDQPAATLAAALTPAQLGAITLNGASANFKLDSQGYLIEMRGTVILVH